MDVYQYILQSMKHFTDLLFSILPFSQILIRAVCFCRWISETVKRTGFICDRNQSLHDGKFPLSEQNSNQLQEIMKCI